MQLDSHRASCAICLLDFQEPRRVSSGPVGSDAPKTPVENQTTEVPETQQEGEGEGEGDITEQAATPATPDTLATPATPSTPITPTSPIGDLALRLQDAGEGAQPLRLLKCGHVFHVSHFLPLPICVSNSNELFFSKKNKRKRVWTRGYSMCRDGVQCASVLCVSRQMRQVQSKALDQNEGGGSEEADGEDRHESVL